MKALLVLLTHLTQRDLVDFGGDCSDANGSSVDVAKVGWRTPHHHSPTALSQLNALLSLLMGQGRPAQSSSSSTDSAEVCWMLHSMLMVGGSM